MVESGKSHSHKHCSPYRSHDGNDGAKRVFVALVFKRIIVDGSGAVYAESLTKPVFLTMSADRPADVIDRLNNAYHKAHTEFEDLFWAQKMDLKTVPWTEGKLAEANMALRTFLGSEENLKLVQRVLQMPGITSCQQTILKQMERTFKCYQLSGPEAVALQAKIVELEVVGSHPLCALPNLPPSTTLFTVGPRAQAQQYEAWLPPTRGPHDFHRGIRACSRHEDAERTR